MKQIKYFLTLFLTVLSTGAAQKSSDVEVTISSGYVIPSSPMAFANYWRMQYGGGIGAGMSLSPSVVLNGNVEYYRFTLNATGISNGFDTRYMRDIWAFQNVSLKAAANASSIMTASLNVRISPSGLTSALLPYFLAGAGVMKFELGEIVLPTMSTIVASGSSVSMTAQQRIIGGSNTVPFFQYGIGFDYHLTESALIFIEARYSRGIQKGIGTTTMPLTSGLRFRL